MAQITAAIVKELRERTGAGMMDCKKALVATEGDMEKAIDFLREKGLSQAAKKAGRVAAEGAVASYISADEKVGVIVEVNCETDFVGQNENFQALAKAIAEQVAVSNPADVDALLASEMDGKAVKDVVTEAIAKIGENISVRRFARFESAEGKVYSYIHGGGKIGVLVDVETDVVNDAIKEMAKNVAMQIAALKPQYTSDKEVSADYIEHEKEILMAQIQNDPKMAGKPEKVIEGAVNGRLNKELKEVCLLEQVYVKAEDGKQTVAQYLAQVAKENNANLTVKGFVRFETGEGIEKKVEDFAAEVAAQLG